MDEKQKSVDENQNLAGESVSSPRSALVAFEKWWASKVAEGYQYGRGPLATVRFGFEAGFAAATPESEVVAGESEITAAFHRGVDAAKDAIRSEVHETSSDNAHYYAAAYITAIARKCGFIPYAPWTPCAGEGCACRSEVVATQAEQDVEGALRELLKMFPHSMLIASQSAGNADTGVPDWTAGKVQIDGQVISGDTLAEAMSKVREFKEQSK